jgi:homospermidine synthase
MSAENVKKLRTIAELRFARDFSPEAFSDHIRETPGGQLEISRLPAENDPILQRIRQIRQRDYLFIDTMQEHYDAFTRRMDSPYQEWRAASYNELVALRELKRQSRNRTIGGVAAIIGGILASGSNSGSGRAAGAVAIGSGALLVKSGLSKRAELQIHEDTLAELAQSLEAEIEPRVIELEDRTITLTGNAAAQYAQWKTLLREIYQAERGGI